MDWAHFQAVEGDDAILLSAPGPGVITRIWATQRSTTAAPAVEEDITVHLWIDGEEVELAGMRGIGLRALGSGTVDAFPRPWVAGPDAASGSFLVALPLHFQHSVRVTAELRPGFDIYYMIDWRELPCGARVRSFDGTLSVGERASLDAATAVWVHGERGTPTEERAMPSLAPGEETSLVLSGPGVVREIELAASDGLAALEAELAVDGEVIAAGPAHVWLMATTPAEAYTSALSSFDGTAATLSYPAPFDEAVVLTVRNAGASAIDVQAALRWTVGAAPPEAGHLKIDCIDHTTSPVRYEENDVMMAELDGPGHLAGHFLVMDAAAFGFAMLEGDPEIFADDRTLLGTGVEDFYGGAHYFIYGPFAHPEQGASGLDASDPGRPRVAMFRHLLSGPVEMERSLRFSYEAYDPGTRFRACTYWYRR
jgi:hypothetical protein